MKLVPLLTASLLCLVTAGARQAEAKAPLVSVQPLDATGAGAASIGVRKQVARVVRQHGFRVTTQVPAASGTGQYYTWAREVGLTAFVSGELVPAGKQRQQATFLVWSGHTGSVVGRWSVSAPAKALPGTVGRQFWRRLGPALRRARCPAEWRDLSPGPTMRINAASAYDGDVAGSRMGRRRRL